jgi:hypothetical protein
MERSPRRLFLLRVFTASFRRLSRQRRGAIVTHKDYILIAEALRTAHSSSNLFYAASRRGSTTKDKEEVACNAVINAAEVMCLFLQRDNPRFDRDHFLAMVRGEREVGSKPQSVCDTPCASKGYQSRYQS